METFVNGRNLSNDEKRIKLSETLNKALYLESIGKKNEAEKLFLKSCRIAENLYRQTFSNKDRIKVVECYIKISEFYQNSDLRMDFVQRWYQKIIGILQDIKIEHVTPLAAFEILNDLVEKIKKENSDE